MSDTFTIGVPSLAKALSLPPQARRVLAHLLAGKSITAVECTHVYRIKRLSYCIFKIRQVGYKVDIDIREDAGGAKYASYKLAA